MIPRRQRRIPRCFRFSLRMLLAGVTLASVLAAYLGSAVREYEREQQALAQIWGEQAGRVAKVGTPLIGEAPFQLIGEVPIQSFLWPSHTDRVTVEWQGPTWAQPLCRWCNWPVFERVVDIHLGPQRPLASAGPHLANFEHLKSFQSLQLCAKPADVAAIRAAIPQVQTEFLSELAVMHCP